MVRKDEKSKTLQTYFNNIEAITLSLLKKIRAKKILLKFLKTSDIHNYIRGLLVVIESREHPIPFRTRK